MATNEAILEEIEALKAIFLDEINVNYTDCGAPSDIEITLMPATGQNVEKQHVRVTLAANISQGYPDIPPIVIFRNPKGIDDEVLLHIESGVEKKCEEFLGSPVIYELTELVRESLTANNVPKCPCAICLFHFSSNDSFTKTECFHYYHSHCLGRYIENCNAMAAILKAEEDLQPNWVERKNKEILCPVCREPLTQVLNCEELLTYPEAEDGYLKDFNGDPEVRALQAKMAALFQQQKDKGGIIDLEEEKNRFLVSSVPETTPNPSNASQQHKANGSNQSVKSANSKGKNSKSLHQFFSHKSSRKQTGTNKNYPNQSRNTPNPQNRNQAGVNRDVLTDFGRGGGRGKRSRGAKTRPPPGFKPLQSENASQASS